jgi:hypothetical protein
MDNVTRSRGAARCLNGIMARDGGRCNDSGARSLGEEVEPACVSELYQPPHLGDVEEGGSLIRILV